MKETVTCQSCGERLRKITNTHLRTHDMTSEEYQEMYPDAELTSEATREKQRKTTKRLWEDQEYREKTRKALNRPEVKEKTRKAKKKNWQEQEFREKITEAIRKAHNRPEVKEKDSETTKRQWGDPETREKVTQAIAKSLAKHPNNLESALGDELTRRGIPFEYEEPIVPYIIDIFIEPDICIEADGCAYHCCSVCGFDEHPFDGRTAEEVREDDRHKTQDLEEQGYTVLRFWGHDILQDVESVVDEIESLLPDDRNPRVVEVFASYG